RGLHLTIGSDDLSDTLWPVLCQELAATANQLAGNGALIWSSLDQSAKAAVEELTADNAEIDHGKAANLRDIIRHGLNSLVKEGKFLERFAKKTKSDALNVVGLAGKLTDAPEKISEWTGLDRRHFNRLIIESCCPLGLPPQRFAGARQRVLAYVGHGEF